MNDGSSFIAGKILGTTKYQMKIWTSSGTLRNNSTHALASRTSHGLSGRVRSVPTSAPTTMATTHEAPATASVQPQASIIHCR